MAPAFGAVDAAADTIVSYSGTTGLLVFIREPFRPFGISGFRIFKYYTSIFRP
jgi:hypothetical protein